MTASAPDPTDRLTPETEIDWLGEHPPAKPRISRKKLWVIRALAVGAVLLGGFLTLKPVLGRAYERYTLVHGQAPKTTTPFNLSSFQNMFVTGQMSFLYWSWTLPNGLPFSYEVAQIDSEDAKRPSETKVYTSPNAAMTIQYVERMSLPPRKPFRIVFAWYELRDHPYVVRVGLSESDYPGPSLPTEHILDEMCATLQWYEANIPR